MRSDRGIRSDEDLLRSMGWDDSRAFAALFERYTDFVYNLTFRRTASWSAAEDITDIVFLELWRQRRRVSTLDGSLRPWLAGVASNQAKRWWRDTMRKSRAVERLVSVSTGGDGAEDHAEAVSSRVDDQRRMHELLAALAELRGDQREVLTLWAWEQLSYEEIATALDIPVGTVRSRLNRARARLREIDGTGAGLRASLSGSPNGATEAMPPSADRGGV